MPRLSSFSRFARFTRSWRFSPVAAAALAAVICARSTQAQVSFNADFGLNSQFVWRGVTSTNRFVIQPDLSVSAPLAGVTVTLGAWGNIEPAHYDGPTEISSLGGLGGPLVTQSELWFTVERTFAERLTTSLGSSAYVYPHVGDLDAFNTVEVIGTATLEAFVSPTVTVAYDVGRIRGAYLEAGLSRAVTSEQRGEVTIGVVTAFSAGQGPHPSERDLAYYARNGLTHVDASASASFSLGRFTIAPEAHVILAKDALVRVAAPDRSRGTKVWFGSTVSWTTARESR